MGKQTSFNSALDKEIERRVDIIEGESYESVPTINKFDILGMVGLGAVCVVGLIWGLM